MVNMAKLTVRDWKACVEEGKWKDYIDKNCSFLETFHKDFTVGSLHMFHVHHRVDETRLCPLYLEACEGNMEIVSCMLRHLRSNKPEELRTQLDNTLCCAVRTHPNVHMIKSLLEQGANVNATTQFLHKALITGLPSLMVDLCSDATIEESLCLKIVKVFCENGASDVVGAFRRAACTCKISVMRYLLSKGAIATARLLIAEPLSLPRDDYTDRSRYEAVKLLLENGADPRSSGVALLLASACHAVNTVSILLRYGADPDVETRLVLESNIALHNSCLKRNVSIVALLIQAYCNVNARGKILVDRHRREYGNIIEKLPELLRGPAKAHMPLELISKGEPLNHSAATYTPLELISILGEEENLMDNISLLIEAGAKVRKDWLDLVDKSLYHNEEVYDLVHSCSGQPQTLEQTCRLCLRNLAKRYPKRNFVENLPLPTHLKGYIVMTAELSPWLQGLADV